MIDTEKIKAYIWYTETKTSYKKPANNSPAYLGEHNGTAYYFHYIKGELTTLDMDFMWNIEIEANSYVIYADECTLSERFMLRNSITFKKIPRDVKKL